jgi:hypothetical protein
MIAAGPAVGKVRTPELVVVGAGSKVKVIPLDVTVVAVCGKLTKVVLSTTMPPPPTTYVVPF